MNVCGFRCKKSKHERRVLFMGSLVDLLPAAIPVVVMRSIDDHVILLATRSPVKVASTLDFVRAAVV
jgi:hypothetical protein